MPTTYNGIGTHYYGKRNVETRHGTCRSCNRDLTLTSYDTRLWFVVIFIPIIPLGRKRIIDQCPVCSRHFAVDADKWETAKQLNVSGAMDKYEANPTPEAAMELHQTMLNFHQMAEAAKFRQAMTEKFPNDAKVHAYLGSALSGIGQMTQAAPYFDRALELRPDLPEARDGVAVQRIAEGKLDEARALLDFLEKPGAAQVYPLQSLETLGDAYQRAGRHEPALEIFRHLLAEFPHASQIVGFRKKVELSEKALGRRKETILPKRKWSWKSFFGSGGAKPAPASPELTWRNLAIVAGIVALGVLALVISNLYIQWHRTLYLVSGLKDSAQVVIDGVGRFDVTKGRPQEVVLKEGHYHARIIAGQPDEFDFDVRAVDYFDRWSDHPVWLINVGGSAVMLENRVTYSRNPPPAQTTVHFGRSFESIGNVTHPFAVLPASLQLKSTESRTLTNLELWGQPMVGLVQELNLTNRHTEALNLAEWSLAQSPNDEGLLQAYANSVAQANELSRGAKFLEPGLKKYPVNIQWHRLYTSFAHGQKTGEWLASLYDGTLRLHPNDSAVLYLRGRVEMVPEKKVEWFDRAIAADQNNPYPLFARGSNWMSVPDWEKARPLLAHAVELRPEDGQFAEQLFLTRLALGEVATIESELNQKLKSGRPDYDTVEKMIDVLTAQNQPTEARRVADDYVRAIERFGPGAKMAQDLTQRHWLYASGGFRDLARHAAKDQTLTGRIACYVAAIELGDPKAAAGILSAMKLDAISSYNLLALSLCYRLGGDEGAAREWEARTIARLEHGDSDDQQAAVLLRSPQPPTDATLAAFFGQPDDKALVCAVLAAKHSTRRADYSVLAQRLNVSMHFPHHLIARATASAH